MLSNKIHIRKLQLSDLAIIVKIAEQTKLRSWCEAALRDCFKPDYMGWMIELNNEPIGFAIIRTQLAEAELMVIAISPNYQGQKLGQKLLKHVIEQLQITKIDSFHLEVRQSNQAALKLYRSLGFEQVGHRKNYYSLEGNRSEDAILMSKLFSAH